MDAVSLVLGDSPSFAALVGVASGVLA